jgi:hypothetical protein
MARSLAAAAAAVILFACGKSSSGVAAPSPPPAAALSGTMFGQAFSPADAAALLPGQGSCTLASVTASATGLAVRFSSFQGICSLMTSQNRTCGTRANATVLTLLIVTAKRGGAAAPVQPGTYTITSSIPAPDSQGNFTIAEAFAAKTEACTAAPSAAFAASGTITINSVGSSVTGSADLTFSDGGHVSGSFSASMCSVQVDVCTLFSDLGEACIVQACLP